MKLSEQALEMEKLLITKEMKIGELMELVHRLDAELQSARRGRETELTDLHTRLNTAKSDRDVMRKRLIDVSAELNQGKIANEGLRSDLKELSRQREAIRADYDRLSDQMVDLRAQRDLIAKHRDELALLLAKKPGFCLAPGAMNFPDGHVRSEDVAKLYGKSGDDEMRERVNAHQVDATRCTFDEATPDHRYTMTKAEKDAAADCIAKGWISEADRVSARETFFGDGVAQAKPEKVIPENISIQRGENGYIVGRYSSSMSTSPWPLVYAGHQKDQMLAAIKEMLTE